MVGEVGDTKSDPHAKGAVVDGSRGDWFKHQVIGVYADLHNKGLIGTIEFRNILEKLSDEFKAVRDRSVDDSITRLADLRRERLEHEESALLSARKGDRS